MNTRGGGALQVRKSALAIRSLYFFWYGGCTVLNTFFILYFQSLGLTVADLSIIYIITPILQCLFPIFSGILADRIGSMKPVLYGTFIFLFIFVNCSLLLPNINLQNQDLNCRHTVFQENLTPSVKCDIQCATMETRFISCFFGKKLSNGIEDVNDDFRTTILAFYQQQKINGNVSFVANSVSLSSNKSEMTSNCEVKCHWTNAIDDNFMVVFISSLVIIIGTDTAISIIYGITDSAGMSVTNTHKSDFGLLRAFGLVSTIIVSPIAGFAIDLTTPPGKSRNYSMIVYIFDLLALISVISIIKVEIRVTAPATQMLRKTWILFRNIDTMSFFLAMITLGTANGFEKKFSPLFLEELHAPTMLFSFLSVVYGAVGLPVLMMSRWWIRKLHISKLFLFAFAGHVINCVGMSLMTNPWWSILWQTLTIFTHHLLWLAVLKHSYEIAPEGLSATIVAAASAIHFGMGTGAGSLIGGLTMNKYGPRTAYRLIAVLEAISGTLYAIFLYSRKRTERKALLRKRRTRP